MPFPTGIVDALDPSRLRLLVEVERRGSISAAADVCAVSQPSATKQLKTLEAAVGEKLDERNGRASRLTEAGEIVATHGARVLDTLQGLEEELGALRGAESGTLALAASRTQTVTDRALARAGYRAANRWELDSNEAIKRSVAAGLGIAFVSKLVVAGEIEREELESFRIEGIDPIRRSIYLLRP